MERDRVPITVGDKQKKKKKEEAILAPFADQNATHLYVSQRVKQNLSNLPTASGDWPSLRGCFRCQRTGSGC